MKLFDETILTAFLDGELDELRRRQVEAALALSPRLASRLAELSQTRALVASLRRPKPPSGLSAGVVAELDARRARRRAPLRLDGPRAATVNAALVALAAAVVVAVNLAPRRHVAPPRPAAAPIAQHAPPPSVEKTEPKGLEIGPGLRAVGRWLVAAAKQAAQAPEGPSEAERRLDERRQALEALLDRRVARFTIAVDPARFDEATTRLEALVDGTPLTRPARARVELDPGGEAGRAVAFAMVMREPERNQFLKALRGTFADVAIVEDRPPATLLTRLAEPRRFDLHDGPAMSPVSTDPDLQPSASGTVAEKHPPLEAPFRVPPRHPDRVGPPAPDEAGPAADPADDPAAAPADDATTVIVWLTAPPQRASK